MLDLQRISLCWYNIVCVCLRFYMLPHCRVYKPFFSSSSSSAPPLGIAIYYYLSLIYCLSNSPSSTLPPSLITASCIIPYPSIPHTHPILHRPLQFQSGQPPLSVQPLPQFQSRPINQTPPHLERSSCPAKPLNPSGTTLVPGAPRTKNPHYRTLFRRSSTTVAISFCGEGRYWNFFESNI